MTISTNQLNINNNSTTIYYIVNNTNNILTNDTNLTNNGADYFTGTSTRSSLLKTSSPVTRPSKVGDVITCTTSVTLDNSQYQISTIYNGNTAQYVVALPNNVAQTPMVSALSSQLQSLHDNNPTLFGMVLNAFSQTTADGVQKAVTQLQPVANGATSQSSMAATSQTLSTVQAHNDAMRADANQTGSAAGDTPLGLSVWGQAFGGVASQGQKDGVDGFDSRGWGFAGGADTAVLDHLRLGLSLAQAFTHVDDSGSRTGSGERIKSTIATLYSAYDMGSWYADSSLSYGWHSTDSARLIDIPGAAQQIATASFTAQQVEVKTEVGMPLPLNTALGTMTATPLASLSYAHFHQPGYTESGSSADLSVSSLDTDSVRSGLGGSLAMPFTTASGWEIKPGLRTVWLHEFDGDAAQQTSSFAAGGASFTTNGPKVTRDHLDLGLRLDLDSNQGTRLSVKYDADLAQHYQGHSGILQATVDF